MTDEQRAREVACDALVACCKLPSDTPVDQYHHEPECDALTAAILQAGRYTKAEADLRCGVRDPNPDNPPEVAVLAPEVAQALTAKDARIAELESALVWCSGSADFQEGGRARVGWLKLCQPLLDTLTPKERESEG